MKNILLVMILGLATLCTTTANDELPAADKIRTLEEQDKKLAAEMFKLRIELIKKDPALLKLHKQILALHKELALKIDSKKEMRILISKAAEVSKQIEALKTPPVPEKK